MMGLLVSTSVPAFPLHLQLVHGLVGMEQVAVN